MLGGREPVALIGFGLLGVAIARRLGAAGETVRAFDVAEDRRRLMVRHGVVAAESVPDAVVGCARVVVAVFSAEQAVAVLDQIAGVEGLGRRAVLLVTTMTPAEVEQAAARADDAGLVVVEYPISGSSREVTDGRALGLVGGDADGVDGVQDVIDAITPQSVRLGGVGTAARAKLAINLVLELNRSALAEGLRFAELLGLELESFAELLRASAASSRVMDVKAAKMRLNDFRPEARARQSLKDVHAVLRLAAAQGQPLPLTQTQAELLEACVAQGDGDLDGAVVFRHLRRIAVGA